MENNETNLNTSSPQEVGKWWILLSGILFCGLGSYFFNKPVGALRLLIFYIAFAKVVIGVSGLSLAFSKNRPENRNWLIAISLTDFLFGTFLLFSPYFKIALTILIPYILAAWTLSRGILMCISAFKDKQTTNRFWFPLIYGILSVLACFVILGAPLISTLALMDVIGIFLIVMGISLLAQFFSLLFAKKK